MSQETIETIVKKQRTFFNSQQTKALTFREHQLNQLKQMIQTNETQLCYALEQDLGKHPTESYMTEIGMVYHSIRVMKKNINKWSKKKKTKTPLFLFPAKSYTLASPYGCTYILSAFNYPVLLSMDPLIGAIAGGNTAIVGLSEHTPNVNKVLINASKSYFSEEYLYMYTSSIEKNTMLLNEPFDKIFFTGSKQVGKIVLKAASAHLTPVTLELGGKSPALVLPDADMTVAAERILWGKLLNAGATCVAPDYVLIDERMADIFIEKIKKALQKMYGREIEKNSDYPRIINNQEFQRIVSVIEADREAIVAGGQYDATQLYIAPTFILGNTKTELSSMTEELFGPVLPIVTYQTEAEAKDYIEKREAPLAFYPFVGKVGRSDEWIKTIQFGGSTVNDTILHLTNPNLPFGGVGHSGMGQYHGKYSFETFTHKKAILERKNKWTLPIMHPPYTKRKETIIRTFLK